MINLLEDYYKIWDNETFTLEATIARSFWDDRVIQTFESKLYKASSEVFKSSKAIFLKKKILISMLFAGDKQVTELNKHYRNINKPTNVLSFPSTQINTKSKIFLGDIVFSSQTIMDEARKDNKNLDDHLIHLFIHGVLHLLGYEHETEDDAYIMESLEIKVLNNLNIDNPYK
ncbi:rRNA maturation RNase YbeY [Alphaproteobacteria bacterium]|nr:rRNA maturation RNase YbeY [Alphaproteobacteria bacterium]